MHGIQILSDLKNNRKKWLDRRKECVTATKIAVISGANPFRSVYEQWAIDTGQIEDDFVENDFTKFGQHNEPFVAKLFAQREDKSTWAVDGFYHHPNYNWAAATPDYFVYKHDVENVPDSIGDLKAFGDGALLECKTSTIKALDYWSETECPKSAYVQLQWQMGVMGIPEGWVAGLIGGDPRNFFAPRFDFDPELWGILLDQAARYKTCVDKVTPPEPTPADNKLIDKIVGERTGGVHELNTAEISTAESIVQSIHGLRKELKELDGSAREMRDVIKEHEARLKIIAGDCSIARFPDGREIKISTVNVKPHEVKGHTYTRVYLPKPMGGSDGY